MVQAIVNKVKRTMVYNGNMNILLSQFGMSHYCYLEFFIPDEDCISCPSS